jgi:hypothetical protein
MRTLIKLGCVSLFFAALSYAVFSATEGRGAWPSTPKYLVVLGMYGFTIIGIVLLLAFALAKLINSQRSAKKGSRPNGCPYLDPKMFAPR